jgi:hypothetical protein
MKVLLMCWSHEATFLYDGKHEIPHREVALDWEEQLCDLAPGANSAAKGILSGLVSKPLARPKY